MDKVEHGFSHYAHYTHYACTIETIKANSFNYDSHPNRCEAKHCSYLVHLWTLCMKMPQWTEHHSSWPIYCVANNVSATRAASECTISSGPSSAHFSQTLNTPELIRTICLFRSNIKSKAVWSRKLNMFFHLRENLASLKWLEDLFELNRPYRFLRPHIFSLKRIEIHNWKRNKTQNFPSLSAWTFFVQQYCWTSWKTITIYKLTEWFLNIPCLVAFAVNLCKIL